jgi:hypothetical protein
MASNGQSTLSPGDTVSDSELISVAAEQSLRIVESRRSGDITTAEATIQFYRVLPFGDRGESALRRYVELCTEIDSDHAVAAVRRGERPERRLRSAGHVAEKTGLEREKKAGEGISDEFETETDTDSDDSASFTRAKRRHLNSSDSDSSARSRKHPKNLAFSWHCYRRDCPPADASTRKTPALKGNHLLDLKAAKNDLNSQLNSPDFPNSLWLDVLANHFINLDKVFSGHYSLESDCRLTKTIDNVDITLSAGGGASKPTKTVETHGEWSIAYTLAVTNYMRSYHSHLSSGTRDLPLLVRQCTGYTVTMPLLVLQSPIQVGDRKWSQVWKGIRCHRIYPTFRAHLWLSNYFNKAI